MLNSCASNVVVVNIDAGFNGGHVAGLIARRAGVGSIDDCFLLFFFLRSSSYGA